MIRFFRPFFLFTVIFGCAKIAFAIYGLFNTDIMASFIMRSVGAKSAMNSIVLSNNLAHITIPYLIGLLVSSILLITAALAMNNGKQWGFFLYTGTSGGLILFFMYAGFNFFPVLLYASPLPLIGILLYISVLEKFWFSPSRL